MLVERVYKKAHLSLWWDEWKVTILVFFMVLGMFAWDHERGVLKEMLEMEHQKALMWEAQYVCATTEGCTPFTDVIE